MLLGAVMQLNTLQIVRESSLRFPLFPVISNDVGNL